MFRPYTAFELGESALVLQLSYGNISTCVAAVQSLYRHFQRVPAVRSLRPALDSIVIEYDHEATDTNALLDTLRTFHFDDAAAPTSSGLLRVPVCYEQPFGADLDRIAEALNLTGADVIDRHLSRSYEVWMIGFMPGFPYMGELDPALRLPRKSRVEPHIAAGSVAIAAQYVGIYPFDSPGGWHVIGRTPLQLVDYSSSKPCLFDYGMRVQFYRINSDEFLMTDSKHKVSNNSRTIPQK